MNSGLGDTLMQQFLCEQDWYDFLNLRKEKYDQWGVTETSYSDHGDIVYEYDDIYVKENESRYINREPERFEEARASLFGLTVEHIRDRIRALERGLNNRESVKFRMSEIDQFEASLSEIEKRLDGSKGPTLSVLNPSSPAVQFEDPVLPPDQITVPPLSLPGQPSPCGELLLKLKECFPVLKVISDSYSELKYIALEEILDKRKEDRVSTTAETEGDNMTRVETLRESLNGALDVASTVIRNMPEGNLPTVEAVNEASYIAKQINSDVRGLSKHANYLIEALGIESDLKHSDEA